MARITVDKLSVYFPLSEMSSISGSSAPVNLSKIGGKRYIHALNNVSFSVQQGQRVGIVGRNGSGKSTLLRVLGQIYSPTSGSVECQGKISSLFNLGLGTQSEVSGRDNIFIRGLVKGYSRRQIKSNIPEIISFSELEDFIDLPIRTYSDGMKMRLLFAIATAFSPEILLLDEWIGAGDSDFQKKAARRMHSLVSKSGITVIASHNRKLLKSICDLGIWLNQGQVYAMGPIEEVYREMDAFYKSQQS